MLKSIGQIPVEAAKQYGDKTALILPGFKLSFNELDAMSNRCANALVSTCPEYRFLTDDEA